MKKVILVFGSFMVLVFTSSFLQAATYPFNVDPGTLTHDKYYTWGLDWSPNSHETIQSVRLSFDNVFNGSDDTTMLYVHLLDSADPGVTGFEDTVAGKEDFFKNDGGFLFQFDIPPYEIRSYSYEFFPSDIVLLSTYLNNGNFGIGFDPDCAPTGSINLSIETTHAPVPASLLLLGSGLLGLVGLKRSYRKK